MSIRTLIDDELAGYRLRIDALEERIRRLGAAGDEPTAEYLDLRRRQRAEAQALRQVLERAGWTSVARHG